jgi:Tfp pilus assembly protein PilP
MSTMKKIQVLGAALVVFLVGYRAVAGDLPNPFSPQYVGEPSVVVGSEGEGDAAIPTHPLKAYPTKGYLLAGTLVSEQKSAAVMSTKSGSTYTLVVGDTIGKNAATLKEIGVDHVVFEEGDKEVLISVRNGF